MELKQSHTRAVSQATAVDPGILKLRLPGLNQGIPLQGPYYHEGEILSELRRISSSASSIAGRTAPGGMFAVVRSEGTFFKLCGVGHTPDLESTLQRCARVLSERGSPEEKLLDIQLLIAQGGGAAGFNNFLPPPSPTHWWRFWEPSHREELALCFSPGSLKSAYAEANTVAAAARGGALLLEASGAG